MVWWIRLLPVWVAEKLALRYGPVIAVNGFAYVELSGRTGPGCCAADGDRLILVEVDPSARGGQINCQRHGEGYRVKS